MKAVRFLSALLAAYAALLALCPMRERTQGMFARPDFTPGLDKYFAATWRYVGDAVAKHG